ALANDDDAAAARAARAMVDAAPEGEVRAAARAVASARALAARREAFARLSERAIAAGLGRGRVVYRCPMAPGRPRWIQARGGAIGNPYLGRSMPTCGEVAHVHGREASDTVATRPTEALELHVVVARVSRKDERCVS
ncbi:MAG: DUF3347 domain-containing protein, partial [Myxococcales bacterium]|nr:DUF3347 domain-containing protein [Myxococcales bacterium]